MKVKDKDFEVYISEDELDAIVQRVAREVSRDYEGKDLVACPILTGAFMFAADLVRKLSVKCEVCFVRYTSYSGMSSTGVVKCVLPFPPTLKGRDVLIVEDVVDTGLSMKKMLEEVWAQEPRSVKICTLFFKPDAFKEDFKVDYVGREVGNEFIVGYGLDYDEEGRELKEVWKVK